MSVSLSKHGSNWEGLAQVDPLWAILSEPEFRHGKWNESEFFATGRTAIGEAMVIFDLLKHPRERDRALDFGCGVGRLTFALAGEFKEVTGVDISPTMLQKAEAYRPAQTHGYGCTFVLNQENHLRQFKSNHYDVVYTTIVLQHVPSVKDIENYIEEFVRIIKPGGLVCFQLPSRIPLRHRFQPRRRLYDWLTAAGVTGSWLYRRLSLHPIQIQCVAHERVLSVLKNAGAKVLKTVDNTGPVSRVQSYIYYATK